MKLLQGYSPARIIGALNRRRADVFRKLQYRPHDTKQLSQAVLFESFHGESVSDSPLDIFHQLKTTHPELTFYWTIRRGKTQAPEGSIGVVWGSRQWLKVLATAKYLVNNNSFPWYFRKVAGQVYLQTWHGTPLKRLGRDIEGTGPSKAYLATMDREAAAWNFLVSPSPYCSQIFPSAFSFSGNIIETGYPRNDRLTNQPEGVRERVRRELGVTDPTEWLVLYAPTWRDYKLSATGNWQAVNYLGKNTPMPAGMRMMFRGHHLTHGAHNSSVAGNAIDVTNYPDVAELYLAADALVTDYSSVMFDFTVTGKPVFFLVPDLERYEAERGFYFDFRAEAPGPICSNVDDLLAELKNIGAASKTYAAKYAAWQQKFNSLEDGKAAARVVEIVFGK